MRLNGVDAEEAETQTDAASRRAGPVSIGKSQDCADRKRITVEQFGLIINDLKNACSEGTLKARAASYAREFGFARAETEAALHQQWRAYTASERAAMFQITYDEYRRLRLQRSGCIEINPAERRRLTKQRYNAKRRAAHAAIRISKSAAYRAPLCPCEKSGTVRVPSLLKVVGKQEPSRKRREISPFSKTRKARDCCRELDDLESYRLWVSAEEASGHQGHRTDPPAGRRVQKRSRETVRGGEHENVRSGTSGPCGQRQGRAGLRSILRASTDHGSHQQRHRDIGETHNTKPP